MNTIVSNPKRKPNNPSINFEENVYTFIEELQQFDYRIEGIDLIWDVIFPHSTGKRNTYYHIYVTKYKDTFYIGHRDGNLCNLQVELNKSVKELEISGRSLQYADLPKQWNALISSARNWLKEVENDWVKANRQVCLSYPLKRRQGIVSTSILRIFLDDIYRIDKELNTAKAQQFIKLVEQGNVRKNSTVRPSMMANEYFKYCKIAYIAGQTKEDYLDETLTGRQMYEQYSDGRDEGLLDIDGNSPEEFADWIDGKHPTKKYSSGHPWRIKRGGSLTSIKLYVSRPSYHEKENFVVTLSSHSFSRLKEIIYMFLALKDAGLPITIDDPEGIRKRLLGQDNIGIVPCHGYLYRGHQRFREHESVYDVMYYDELGKFKTQIKPFITWEPLSILKKREL